MAYINGNNVAFGANLHMTDGYTDEQLEAARQEAYKQGLDAGKQEGLKDLEEEKRAAWNRGMQEGYNHGLEEGYNSAFKTGTVTFTETSKILSISGLPSEPKELHLLAFNAYTPTNDNDAFVGALNYIRDVFSYGGNAKIKAAVWLRTNTGAANGSVAEKIANQNNVFKFDNGVFDIDLTYSAIYCFGENYTYKWTAIF